MVVNPLDPTRLNLDASSKSAQKMREFVEDGKTVPLPDRLSANPTMAEMKRVLDQHHAYLETQRDRDFGPLPLTDHSGALGRLLDDIVQELERLGSWSGNGILFSSGPAGMGASVNWAPLKRVVALAAGRPKTSGISGLFYCISADAAGQMYDPIEHQLWLLVQGIRFKDGLAVDFEGIEEWLVLTAEVCP